MLLLVLFCTLRHGGEEFVGERFHDQSYRTPCSESLELLHEIEERNEEKNLFSDANAAVQYMLILIDLRANFHTAEEIHLSNLDTFHPQNVVHGSRMKKEVGQRKKRQSFSR